MGDLITLSANGAGGAGIYGSVFGGAGADTVRLLNVTAGAGTGLAMNFFGGRGNDSISVIGGSNSLAGGAGADTLISNFFFTGGGLASGQNFDGGTGVDQIVFATTARTNLQINTAITGTFGNTVISNFTDAGDNIVLGVLAQHRYLLLQSTPLTPAPNIRSTGNHWS